MDALELRLAVGERVRNYRLSNHYTQALRTLLSVRRFYPFWQKRLHRRIRVHLPHFRPGADSKRRRIKHLDRFFGFPA